jgi:signal peptide peptidase-like protein 3
MNISWFLGGDDESKEDGESDGSGEKKANASGIQTLDSIQAMCLPLGASISLLVMFFFFDSMQMLFAICTAVIATVALAFLLLPMCQYLTR